MFSFEDRARPRTSGVPGSVLRGTKEMGRLNERVALAALFESPDLTARDLATMTGFRR